MDLTDTLDICEFVNACVEPEKDASLLLQYLIQIQHRYNYVPAKAITQLQHLLHHSGSQILQAYHHP